jgi:hypothetical protein
MRPIGATRAGRLGTLIVPLFVLFLGHPVAVGGDDAIDKKRIEDLGRRWFAARPPTRFQEWDPAKRAALLEEARALGPIPEGSLSAVRDLLWKAARREWPKPKGRTIVTPYGEATWEQSGNGGPKSGLVIGLHGGGPGQGSSSEASGTWKAPGHLGMYPQGIRLVDDTWNTVHGERFVLSLIEIAKVHEEIDPDRVYAMGFSMGGTGSWFLAGRHPDLLAAAVPGHGVLMAEPKSQVWTKAEIVRLQHGFVPNVRNLAVWFYTGLADDHCMPGTFLLAWDQLQELKAADPGGYAELGFAARPGLGHAYPPGEPKTGIDWAVKHRRVALPEKIRWEHATDPYPLPDAEDRVARFRKEWFYWLRCLRPADAMEVTATRSGNELDLEIATAFPGDFEVLLNPSMIDPAKDVVVRVDGKEVWRGRPVPDVATVLETLDARMDRTLVFDRKVTIPE